MEKKLHEAIKKELERNGQKDDKALIDANMKSLMSPWFRYFLTYDPKPTLTKVKCPVLAINGQKDLQVPPKENLNAIEEALKAGGNTRYTVKELPGLNHLFQAAGSGLLDEYDDLEETFNPDALGLIGDWLETHGFAGPKPTAP